MLKTLIMKCGMMKGCDNVTKFEKIMLGLILTILAILIALFIYVMIDFKNDYDCSTTTDVDWYIKHDCMRYER